MNKGELVQAVAKRTNLTRKDVAAALGGALDEIRDALRKGERVTLVGFGGFEVRSRKARQGRNPQTGAKLRIKARKVPAFHAGKTLREAVNR